MYKESLTKIYGFVKSHQSDIIIYIIVALLLMLSFAAGFIIAKYQFKEPIKISAQGGPASGWEKK